MKKLVLLFACWLMSPSSFGQPIPARSIEDSLIGWKKVYHFKGAKEPRQVGSNHYSIAQLSICDSFANWMQASYVPMGALGDLTKTISGKIGLYNQNDAALPPAYGCFVKAYTELKYVAGKIEPLSNSHLVWTITANQAVGTSLDKLNTPTQHYFVMPSFKEQGYTEETDKAFAANPLFKKYDNFLQRNSVTGNQRTVMLFRNNKSPFVPVSKGEYLRTMAETIDRMYQTEKKKIHDDKSNDQRDIDYFMKYLDDKNAKRVKCLKENQERYKNRLQEPAETYTNQPDAMLENIDDVFTGTGGSGIKLPVYKIDPAVAEACKSNHPQWIVVSWTTSINEPVGKHLYESIINNFNFDYLYNFFYDPAKVKGQPYKPLRSPIYREQVIATESSAASKTNKANSNIFFFDDFSSTPMGKVPIGWRSELNNDGIQSTVVQLEGLDGKWAKLSGNNTLLPLQLPKPLPQNFALSYDVVVFQGFTWGSKGLTLKLAKELSQGSAESYLVLKLRPGYDGRGGELSIEGRFPSPPGYLNSTKWMEAIGFSNDKKHNKVNVTIKKKEESLLIFLDGRKIVELDKAIPAAHLFNALSFNVPGFTGDNDNFYISQIRITKD